MKRFILKSFVIVILLITIDVLVGWIHGNLYLKIPEKNTDLAIMKYALFDKKCEVLIMGASTARHNYNPELFRDSLGLSTFNSGLDGRNIIYSDVVVESYLQRCALKCIILDVTESQFAEDGLDRMDITKVFYGYNDYVTRFFDDEYDWRMKLKLKCNLYRYNKSLTDIIRVATKGPMGNGYTPLYGSIDSLKREDNNTFVLGPTMYKYFDRMVTVCQAKKILLFLVQSPTCFINKSFDNWIYEYAQEHDGVYLINERANDFYYNHPDLFKDEGHLNAEGATFFSNAIINQIRNILKEYGNNE